jgi:hypothetical protein
MKALKQIPRQRHVALVVLLMALAIAGGAFAMEVIEGKSLDPVKGTIFQINNGSIVNAAWHPDSTSFTAAGSRIGPQIHRLQTADPGKMNAENWQQYE